MTQSEFVELCNTHQILPEIAFENENVRNAITHLSGADQYYVVVSILETEF